MVKVFAKNQDLCSDFWCKANELPYKLSKSENNDFLINFQKR